MKRLFTIALIATLPAANAAWASSYETLNEERRAEITQKMTADGYEVRKIDVEDGMIEVYALRDGQRFELYLDDEFNIVKTKQDD